MVIGWEFDRLTEMSRAWVRLSATLEKSIDFLKQWSYFSYG